jgi:hypothetical protein
MRCPWSENAQSVVNFPVSVELFPTGSLGTPRQSRRLGSSFNCYCHLYTALVYQPGIQPCLTSELLFLGISHKWYDPTAYRPVRRSAKREAAHIPAPSARTLSGNQHEKGLNEFHE